MRILYIIILAIIAISTEASDRKTINITNIVDECSLSSATAASNMHLYEGTKRLQLMTAVGNTGDCTTVMFGAGKKLNSNGPLLSVTVGKDKNDTSVGAGILWIIK